MQKNEAIVYCLAILCLTAIICFGVFRYTNNTRLALMSGLHYQEAGWRKN